MTFSLLTLPLVLQQWEQQQFQRSRRFLLRVGRSLGKSSALYCQLVSLLQGSPAPSAQDLHQVSLDWPELTPPQPHRSGPCCRT